MTQKCKPTADAAGTQAGSLASAEDGERAGEGRWNPGLSEDTGTGERRGDSRACAAPFSRSQLRSRRRYSEFLNAKDAYPDLTFREWLTHPYFRDARQLCSQMNAQIENAFTYHPPKPGQAVKYERLRAKAKELAYLMDEVCPNSREKSTALTTLQSAVMWANAAVACNE